MIPPVPASCRETRQQVWTRPLTGMLMPAGFGATRQGAAVVAAALRLAALPPSMVNLGWEYPAELLQGSDGALPEVPGDRSVGLHHEVRVGLVLTNGSRCCGGMDAGQLMQHGLWLTAEGSGAAFLAFLGGSAFTPMLSNTQHGACCSRQVQSCS